MFGWGVLVACLSIIIYFFIMLGLGLGTGKGGVSPSAMFEGVLDEYQEDLGSVYDVNFRLLKSYTGPLFRVVRSSDLSEFDIFPNVDGTVNKQLLSSISTSSVLRVIKIYDQNLNGELGNFSGIFSNYPVIANNGVVNEDAEGNTFLSFNGMLYRTSSDGFFGVVAIFTLTNSATSTFQTYSWSFDLNIGDETIISAANGQGTFYSQIISSRAGQNKNIYGQSISGDAGWRFNEKRISHFYRPTIFPTSGTLNNIDFFRRSTANFPGSLYNHMFLSKAVTQDRYFEIVDALNNAYLIY